jgi:hypothetical protein
MPPSLAPILVASLLLSTNGLVLNREVLPGCVLFRLVSNNPCFARPFQEEGSFALKLGRVLDQPPELMRDDSPLKTAELTVAAVRFLWWAEFVPELMPSSCCYLSNLFII